LQISNRYDVGLLLTVAFRLPTRALPPCDSQLDERQLNGGWTARHPQESPQVVLFRRGFQSNRLALVLLASMNGGICEKAQKNRQPSGRSAVRTAGRSRRMRVTAAVGAPAASPIRTAGLEKLEETVLQMFSLVREALAGATQIFLTPDRDEARALLTREQLIDALHRNVEHDVLNELVRPNPYLDDPEAHRRLLLILRILPELERSGDLAEHIASHAAQGLARWLPPRALSLVGQMGALGTEMWEMAAAAYASGDATAADLLRSRDDEIDDLHVSLTAELAAGGISIPVAIEMGLVARYFERLGDHAVNVTRRLEDLRVLA
jgi:phosphate transport system protein